MVKKKYRRIVIDASVARSAGKKNSVDPVACLCRDFLNKVLYICHRAVMTEEISGEWHKHRSLFALKWRSTMTAKKKIKNLKQVHDIKLRNKISIAMQDSGDHKIVKKDLPLIEAAIATDSIVISRDDEVRELLSKLTEKVGELKSLVWLNPAKKDEQAIEWLESGAKLEKNRRIGFIDNTI